MSSRMEESQTHVSVDLYKEATAAAAAAEEERRHMSVYAQVRLERLLRGATQDATTFNNTLSKQRQNNQVTYNLYTRQKHVPYARQPVFQEAPMGRYPVALLPAHFQDYRPDV